MFDRIFGRKRKEGDFKTEIESHLQLEIERLRGQGLSEEQAHSAAYRAFGNVTKTQERFYESSHWLWIDLVSKDFRYAFRMLRKSPSFTLVAILTLTVAIGANAVVFAVLNAMILRPLKVPQPESLYGLQFGEGNFGLESYPNYLDFRDRNQSFNGLAAFSITQAGLDTGENPSRVWVNEVSGNYFEVLDIQPYLGRLIHSPDEHGANSAPYVVLSYGFWHSHFQDDRSVVGRTIQLNKHPFTIIGVTPRDFSGTLILSSPDLFVPIVDEEQVQGSNFVLEPNLLNARGPRWIFETIGHLKTGVTPAQATADLNSIGAWLQKTYPKDNRKWNISLARPSLYGDFLGRPILAFLTALLLLAGLILLAACANLGSLFAARASDRSREIAMRLALGSSRLRVLRQLFTEAILVSLIGGAAGLWGSIVLLRWLSAWRPFPQFPLFIAVSPDAKVYAVALLLALVCGFLSGVVPIRQILETDPYGVIKSGSTEKAGRRITARDLLLGVQIAICAVLVTASFVAARGLARSLHSDFGIEPENAMLADTDLNMAGYSADKVPAMQKRMIETIQTIPGVGPVGLVGQWPPLNMGSNTHGVFKDQTTDFAPSNIAADAIAYSISPGYFQAAGTHLLAGRDFTWQDEKNAPLVAVINPEFAHKILGSVELAMGRYFKLNDHTRIQVVGVVEQGKYTANLAEDPRVAMFLPILQSPSSETSLVVRSGRDPQQVASAIRTKLRELDSSLPSFIQTWNEAMNGALFAPRIATMSLGVLGFMGALLSLTGIFGMAAYAVSKRKRELGIRMALGAQSREVVQAALGRAFKLLAFGSAAGLALGILASRVLASIVYQATPRDPLVLAGVVLAMALVGLVATWVPAQRALHVDPVTLLREE